MKYWLLKSEPNVWSIDQQMKAGINGVEWDGVRNYQAANNLKNMKIGDLCFFYHSNIGKEIVGIVKVTKEAFVDPTDKMKKFIAIKVKFEKKLKKPVSLQKIKYILKLYNCIYLWLCHIKSTRKEWRPAPTLAVQQTLKKKFYA